MQNKQPLSRNFLQAIFQVCWLEVQRCVKDKGAMMFFLLVPLGYPLLYSWIYTNEVVRDVPIVVVDLSQTQTSRTFTRLLDASADVKVGRFCTTLSAAQKIVEQQEARGVVVIPKDLEQRIHRGEQAQIKVYCDMSMMLPYKAILQSSQMVVMQMGSNIRSHKAIISGTERDEELNAHPIIVEEVPIFNTTLGYGNSILPAVLILILQQTLILGIGLLAGTEREKSSYYASLMVSNSSRTMTKLIGKSLGYLMVYIPLAAYVTLAVPRFFSFTAMATPTDLTLFLFPYLLAVIFFSITLSSVIRYRENVILVAVFTSLPLLFLSGVSWPESNIPAFWRGVAWLFPSTFGIRGFLRLSSMGASLNDIHTEHVALWIQAAVYFFVAYATFSWRSKKKKAGKD
ncbi:MAG: ABC transporter permease [Prevotella sp.]|nr:ABC transporter permease [Prevotella sp.]MDY4217258.1 ABC transporter permease [Prevotella sp.]